MPLDVARWQPDFLAFPTYKWVLGPYSLAFLYAAPHRQSGLPLEENNNRPGGHFAPAPAATTRASATTPSPCPWRRPVWNWWHPGARRRWKRGCAP
ncbi:hypothetical protein ACFQU7_09950 [Pseudoroseomonas wenyumeiae]